MIEIIEHGTTRIGIAPIAEGPGSRRQRETACVEGILRHMGIDEPLGHDADGAPVINGVNVSVSHSRTLAAVAIDAVNPVGIDVEEWRDQLSRIATRFLSDAELEYFPGKEPPGVNNPLLKAWTAKEAAYKVAGTGVEFAVDIEIAPDFSSVRVKNQSGQIAGLYDLYFFANGYTLIALAKDITR